MLRRRMILVYARTCLKLAPACLLILVFYRSGRVNSFGVDSVNTNTSASSTDHIRGQIVFNASVAKRVDAQPPRQAAPDVETDSEDARKLASLARSAPIPSKPYKMVMCTRIWNEARYLDEWITYHYLLGFDHFMLDDHGSTDNTSAVLLPYINAGLVTLTQTDPSSTIVDSEASSRQHCHDGSVISNKDMDWVAQIDLDEFLVYSQSRYNAKTFRPTPVQNYMDEYARRKEAVIQVTRLHFGTNNHKELPKWPHSQADSFTERKIIDEPGNFWPKTLNKAGKWRPMPGAEHATQHCSEPVEGWSRVTAVHQLIPPRPNTITEWEYLQQWPVVHDPFHIAHFQTRSLAECLEKQSSPKTKGSWRAAAGDDAVCNAWHPSHSAYRKQAHLFTEHLALKNSVYNRATRRILRTGGLLSRH